MMLRSEPHSVLDLRSNFAFSPEANGQSPPPFLFFPSNFSLAHTGEQLLTDDCIRVGSAVHPPLHEDGQKKSHRQTKMWLQRHCPHFSFLSNAGAYDSDVIFWGGLTESVLYSLICSFFFLPLQSCL